VTARHGRLAVAALGELAKLRLGTTPPRAHAPYWRGGSVPWVTIGDLSTGAVAQTRERISLLALADYFGGSLVPAGTLLLSFKLTVGKVGILNVPAVHNEAIVSIFVRESVDRDYLFYWLQQADLTAELDTYVKGKILSKAKVERLRVPLPPLAEQRRVARILATIQRAREASNMVQATAKGLVTSLRTTLEQAATGWPYAVLGDLARISTGKTPPTFSSEYWSGDVPFVRTSEITGGQIDDVANYVSDTAIEQRKTRVSPQKTVLLAMGGRGKTRGNVALLLRSAATSHNTAAIVCDETRLHPDFLFYYLKGKYRELRQRGTHGHVSHLTARYLRELPVPCPSLKEQKRYVAVIQAAETKIAADQRAAKALTGVFDSAQRRLFQSSDDSRD